MKTQLTILGSTLTVLFVACGGGYDRPHDPPSVPTPQPSQGAVYAEANARVSSGTITANPNEAQPGGTSGGAAPATTTAPTPTAASTMPPPSGTTAGRPPVPVTSPTQSPYPTLPPGPCDACKGTVTPDLQSALTKRAQDSRSCYVRLLTNNPNARASMNIEVRVGRDGTSCDVVPHVDPPEWPGLAECVANEFRKNNLPLPGNGSCVVARVPLQFTPAQ